jgi:hypothetical protein
MAYFSWPDGGSLPACCPALSWKLIPQQTRYPIPLTNWQSTMSQQVSTNAPSSKEMMPFRRLLGQKPWSLSGRIAGSGVEWRPVVPIRSGVRICTRTLQWYTHWVRRRLLESRCKGSTGIVASVVGPGQLSLRRSAECSQCLVHLLSESYLNERVHFARGPEDMK